MRFVVIVGMVGALAITSALAIGVTACGDGEGDFGPQRYENGGYVDGVYQTDAHATATTPVGSGRQAADPKVGDPDAADAGDDDAGDADPDANTDARDN